MITLFSRPRVTILVLCTANICRSPAAEGLLRDAFKRLGLGRRVTVVSAGTEAAPSGGMPPDPRMVAIAAERGIKLRSLRSQPLTPELLHGCDAVYGMEPAHVEAALAMLDGEPGPEVALIDPDGSAISDPYFGDKAGVRRAFEQLAAVAERRAQEWQQRLAVGE